MDKIYKIVNELEGKGIDLKIQGQKLIYKGPKESMNQDVLATLKQNKEKIIQLLSNSNKEQIIIESSSDDLYEPFQLTDVQAAYMLGRDHAFQYSGVGCHIYLELEYKSLDFEKVQLCWNVLLKRHEMLRMYVTEGKMQLLSKAIPQNIVKLWILNQQNNSKMLSQIRSKFGHKLYDVYKCPLFDIGLVKRDSEEDILFISLDLLIADWTSIWLLISEFEKLYYSNEELTPLSIAFKDYMKIRCRMEKGIQYYRDKEFWKNKIDTLPGAPQLPMLHDNNIEISKPKFKHYSFFLEKKQWDKIVEFAKLLSITPTVAVMTAYALVLRRWSTNKEFSLNLTLLNRLSVHNDINKVVGDFTEVSLLECIINSNFSFVELAQQLQRTLMNNIDHRLFSGVKVLREIGKQKGRDNALMPYVFTSAIGLLGKTITNSFYGKMNGNGISQTPQVFIDCQAMDDNDGLKVFWDVREGIFPEGLVEDMFSELKRILNNTSENIENWSKLSYIDISEGQNQEKKTYNSTSEEFEICRIEEEIYLQYEKHPDQIAVIDNKNKFTYHEVIKEADNIKVTLQKCGCVSGDYVGIMLEKSAYQLVAALGALLAGTAYVPIDIKQPEERIYEMLKQAGVKFVLMEDKVNRIQLDGVKSIYIDQIEKSDKPMFSVERLQNTSESAYVIFTSGSTGKPKGVEISHESAMNTILDINKKFGINESDKFIGVSRMSFDLSVYDLFGCLVAGGTLIMPEEERATDPSYWAYLISKYNITVWNTVPALMQMLVNYAEYEKNISIDSLRTVLLSGDWIPVDLPKRVRKLCADAKVISLGGATEAAIWSIYHFCLPTEVYDKSIPYGKPLSNQAFYVLDSEMQECPVWVNGDLYIGGKGLAKGYINNNELTNLQFVIHEDKRLYKTGDIGRHLPGGEIEFLGREDTQVKINGYRIELGEIEGILNQWDAVSQAVVLVNEEKSLLVAVVLQSDKVISELNVKEHLLGYLPQYMIPQNIVIVKDFPLTDNGKINRQEIEKLCQSSNKKNRNISNLNDSIGSVLSELLEIWKEALALTELSPNENLYKRGADSLIMAQVVSKVRSYCDETKLYDDISFDKMLRQLLNYPTVLELNNFISDFQANEGKKEEKTQSFEKGNGVINYFNKKDNDILHVLLHAGFGTMNCFRFMVEHMKKENTGTIIGITIRDSEHYCELVPEKVIDILADEYAEMIAQLGKNKVQVVGYCIGGLIAIEVARRLMEKGVDIYDLVLIDSHPIHYKLWDDFLIEIMFLTSLGITISQTQLGKVDDNEFYDAVLYLYQKFNKEIPQDSKEFLPDKYRTLYLVLNSMNKMSMEKRFELYSKTVKSVTGNEMPSHMAIGLYKTYAQSFKAAQYKPSLYVGDIRFLLAEVSTSFIPNEDTITLEFWKDICLGELTVDIIGGNHISCTESEPNATFLAQKILLPFM